jgi:hypothetical protein
MAHADVLHATREDVKAALRREIEREHKLVAGYFAQQRGIPEAKAREWLKQSARRGSAYPSMRPASAASIPMSTVLQEGARASGTSWWDRASRAARNVENSEHVR